MEFRRVLFRSRARLPSLLLQPLVENAIKYAVTPQEEGADITLSAQLAGENVRITVSDTGLGLSADGADPTTGHATESTGVGLANIRERSEERRVGKEGVRTGRSRWWAEH